jgi:hypothetical protein
MPKRRTRFEEIYETLDRVAENVAVPPRLPACSTGALEAWLAEEKASRHRIDNIVREWLIPPRHPLPIFVAVDAGWLSCRLLSAKHWALVGSHFVLPIGYSTGAVYRTLLIDSWPSQLECWTGLLEARWQVYKKGCHDCQSQTLSE